MKSVKKQPLTVGDFVRQAAERFDQAGLVFGHGTTNAFDEAAFLALETLGLDDLEQNPWEVELTPPQTKILEDVVQARLETRKPASYLVNRAYIQGIPFYVDERVIVPRSFIGEILCHEEGFSQIEGREINRVLDLCTGSGCLAILAAHLFPDAEIDAVELSPGAAEVARRNIGESGFEDRLTLFEGDLFAPLKNKRYDLIITNPPYVDAVAMRALPPEYKQEPAMALAGGKDGLDIVRRILKEAPDYLTPEGGLLCEIGQGKDILEKEYGLPFLWLDTEGSSGEVFWLTRKQFGKK